MSQVIAGIYEIQEKIGAGGGGVVYLGKHLRLKKQIVLKADKRTLGSGEEALRREVDLLKELSQTYIPQVYDFVQEDGVVYTVMDFIEGESLDKLLGRGQLPTQPQVIRWACQLLEALNYLHNCPPHGILHGDIKPANIMLRDNGDICLIDFNIALALGEDGAVKVGFSRGYASPEHYGVDYIKANRLASVGTMSENTADKRNQGRKKTVEGTVLEKTLAEDGDSEKTQVEADATVCDFKANTDSRRMTESTAGGKKEILLDVRSDIYSLGATLYHLLSGRKPAQDAREVVPLGQEVCSPVLSAILQKAMAPDPNMRYQTAEEMLTAFLQIHKKDKRVIAHKRRMRVSIAMLSLLFLGGGACSFVGLKQMEQIQTAFALSEYSANALSEGDVNQAVRQALQAIPQGNSLLDAPVTAQAQKALTDALGVYDLSDGFKTFGAVELPAAPFDLAVSPEGSRFAVVYAYEAAVYDTESCKKIAVLPILNSARADCIFVNENLIIYAGDGGVTAYNLENKTVLWTGEIATSLSLSADGARLAAVNRDADHALIYQVADGGVVAESYFGELHMAIAANDIFADPKDYVFSLNEDGSLLAVSFSNGGLILFDVNNPENNLYVYEKSDYEHFSGGFYKDYFGFTAQKSGSSFFGLIDTQDAVYLGGYESNDSLLLQADKRGMYLANGNLLESIIADEGQRETGVFSLEEKELAYTNSTNITAFSVGDRYVLTATDDNNISFYDSGANLSSTHGFGVSNDFVALSGEYAILGNRNEPFLRLLKLEDHKDACLLEYDARYEHEEARVSQDGKTVMLFSYQGFRIYDMDGNLLAEVELPDAGNIYDQQFRKEETSRLEVIWYDGVVRSYSAEDGSLLTESQGERPNRDLYEEFYTDTYRITSSLHDAPQVYDIETDRLVAVLEEDDYLTYVTQMGEYIVTEYISTTGERYGLLLDEKLRKLAYLPGLCDVADENFIFDYESGNLRQCRLYSLQELIALGETY